MKQIFITLGIALLTFSSCSKDDLLEKNPTFFFFEVKYGNDQIVEYGHAEEYNNNVYEGPKYQSTKQNDSSMISLWPDYNHGSYDPWAYMPTKFSKNGTDILGDYTVDGNAPWTLFIHSSYDRITHRQLFLPLPGTEKLTIIKTGDSKYGKYAEGTLTFDSHLEYDTVNVVRASATFRLKME